MAIFVWLIHDTIPVCTYLAWRVLVLRGRSVGWRVVSVTAAGQLEWLLQGKEKSILEDSEAAIDDDNNGR